MSEDVTQEHMRQSEAQWKLVFENAPDAYYLIDHKATIYEINRKALEMIGYSREEVVGKNGLQLGLLPKMGVKKVMELLVLNAMGKPTGPDEITFIRRDGTLLEIEAVAQPVTINNKKLILGIARDIGKRKRAERDLQDHQEKLELAMEAAGMVNWEYDVARDTFTFDDRFYRLYGTSAEKEGGYQMASKVYAEKFVYPEDRELVGEEIAKLLQTKDPNYSRQLDHRIVRADGVVRYVSVRFKAILNDEGKVVRTIGANQDITVQKQVEIAIQRREKIMSVLNASMERFLKSSLANWDENVQHYVSQVGTELRTSRVFLIKHRMVDASGVEGYLRFEWAIEENRQLMGKTEAETIRVVREEHQPWFDAVASKKAVEIPLEKMPQWWRGSLCSPEAKRLILAAVYVDDYWWGVMGIEDYELVADQSVVELEAFGSMAALFGSAVARKWADERLSQFELGIERSNDVVFLADPEGKIEYINLTFSTVYGYTLEEVRGKTPRVLKSGKQSVAFYEKFWSILKSGQALKTEFINKTKDGRLVTMAASVSPITDKTGEMIGYLAIQRDITETKEKELKLRASNAELERLNNLMVGRELKMRELKETIKQLQVAQEEVGDGSS